MSSISNVIFFTEYLLYSQGILTHMPSMVLQGDNMEGARFGTAITNVGDLNRDGYHGNVPAPISCDITCNRKV